MHIHGMYVQYVFSGIGREYTHEHTLNVSDTYSALRYSAVWAVCAACGVCGGSVCV